METGYLTIETYPDSARIYIDNVLVLDEKGQPALSPVTLVMSVGYHDIRLELEGYFDEFDGQYIMKNETVTIFHNFNIHQ
jgi:hypothetical protein